MQWNIRGGKYSPYIICIWETESPSTVNVLPMPSRKEVIALFASELAFGIAEGNVENVCQYVSKYPEWSKVAADQVKCRLSGKKFFSIFWPLEWMDVSSYRCGLWENQNC